MNIDKSHCNLVNAKTVFIAWFMLFTFSNGHGKFVPEEHPNWRRFDEMCGLSLTKRIIGGEEAQIGEFPWLALIGKNFVHEVDGLVAETNYFFCGGALLNRFYVLTASHCSSNQLNIIRVGEFDRFTNPDCIGRFCAPSVQDRQIKEVFPFEKTVPDAVPTMDILLYKVEEPFLMNDFVQPICLPTREILNLSLAGEIATTAGWGVIEQVSGKVPRTLQKLNMVIKTDEECRIWLQNFQIEEKPVLYHNEYQLCAYGSSSSMPCQGDSGGPLFKKWSIRDFPQHFIIGVTSYGDRECEKGYTVFARVTAFVKWILDTVDEY